MSKGTQTRAMVDKLLTNVSNGRFNEFIADDILTPLIVKQKTGLIGTYGTQHLRIVNDLQTGQSEARRVNPVERNQQMYSVSSHSLETVVTEDDYDNVEEPFQAESDATMGLTSLILTNKERALAAGLFDPANIPQGVALSGTSKFSDYGNSNPTEVFKTAQGEVLESSGKMPNAAVMSAKTFLNLIYHPEILRKLGYADNRAGTLSKEELARAMNVSKLFIGDAAYESAKEGLTSNIQQVWGNSILFYVRPDAAARQQVALGYYIKLSSRGSRRVLKYPLNNPIGATGIIADDNYSFEIVNPDAGYLISDAI